MVLQPGQHTTLSMEFMMHAGMEGMHDFRVHLPTNDPAQPDQTLTVLSNWVPSACPKEMARAGETSARHPRASG